MAPKPVPLATPPLVIVALPVVPVATAQEAPLEIRPVCPVELSVPQSWRPCDPPNGTWGVGWIVSDV